MKKRLLLIDDDPILLNVLNDFFVTNGFDVILAVDGLSALSCYKKSIPDLVLMDLDMPVMNGFEVIEKIREDDFLTPIILMTGSWMEESYKIRGYELGVVQFLEKPVKVPVLLAQIRSLLHPPITEHKICGFNREYRLRGQILFVENAQLKFREREAQILALLFDHQGSMVSRKKIQLLIWNDDSYRNNKSLDNLVYQVKKKLEAFPELCIRNAYSKGYVLEFKSLVEA